MNPRSASLRFLALAFLATQWVAGWWIALRPRRLPTQPEAGEVSRIAVIVPARNEAHAIGDAVRSIVAQGPVLAEVVVVDDGSSDDTAEIARAAGARVDRDVGRPDAPGDRERAVRPGPWSGGSGRSNRRTWRTWRTTGTHGTRRFGTQSGRINRFYKVVV